MAIQPFWQQEATVKPYETDFRGEWKAVGFFQAMQLAAGQHASHLGFDYHDMLANGMVWVLSRVKIVFQRFPRLEEAVTVRTWPRGLEQKIFFRREFQFLSGSGEVLAAATSAWLLIDPHKRRLLIPGKLPGHLPLNEGFYALEEQVERIPFPAVSQACRTVQANYSSVDLMGHVNNTRYVEWVLDCFPFEHHQKHRLGWLQINYNNEVLPREQVALLTGNDTSISAWYVQGNNLASGARAFEAALGWKTLA